VASSFKTNSKALLGGRTGGLVSLFISDTDQLLASAFGKTCCLDLFTGAHRWTNNMDVSSIVSILISVQKALLIDLLRRVWDIMKYH
jgi:hypothetical protein